MNQARAGYSLFEVLIAFAIMSLVLTALIPGQARLLGRAVDSDQRLLALDYAHSRRDAMSLTNELRIGTAEKNYQSWTVSEEVRLSQHTKSGQIVDIAIEISGETGTILARLESVGFISDAP